MPRRTDRPKPKSQADTAAAAANAGNQAWRRLPSVTRDEEEDDETASDQVDPHAALVDEVRQGGGSQREGMAYLLRYETMVRQQEAEDMATFEHVRPCIERIKELALGISINNSNSFGQRGPTLALDTAILGQEVSFLDLQKALQGLESQTGIEFFSTDRQLMMVLRLLASKVHEVESPETLKITWAEFLQCYKTCIAGMMTLQHLPDASTTRSRARDRTLTMLSLFEPSSTKILQDEAVANAPVDSAALNPRRRGSDASRGGTSGNRSRNMESGGGSGSGAGNEDRNTRGINAGTNDGGGEESRERRTSSGNATRPTRRPSVTLHKKASGLGRIAGALLLLGLLGYTQLGSKPSKESSDSAMKGRNNSKTGRGIINNKGLNLFSGKRSMNAPQSTSKPTSDSWKSMFANPPSPPQSTIDASSASRTSSASASSSNPKSPIRPVTPLKPARPNTSATTKQKAVKALPTSAEVGTKTPLGSQVSQVQPDPLNSPLAKVSAVAGGAVAVALTTPIFSSASSVALVAQTILRASIYGWGVFSLLASFTRSISRMVSRNRQQTSA
jgi:hypothetical protein